MISISFLTDIIWMITCSIISSSYPKKFQDLWIQKYKIDIIKACKEIANFRRNLILIVKLGKCIFWKWIWIWSYNLILFTIKKSRGCYLFFISIEEYLNVVNSTWYIKTILPLFLLYLAFIFRFAEINYKWE